MVQWTISSDERRELGRAAGPLRGMRRSRFLELPIAPHAGDPISVFRIHGLVSALRQLRTFASLASRLSLCPPGLISQSACAPNFPSVIIRVLHSVHDRHFRAVELDDHPFFVATLFQPERAALLGKPVPLVNAFVAACAKE